MTAVAQVDFASLLAEGAELERTGEGIQGERELAVSERDFAEFAEHYLKWMAAALTALPEDLSARFRSEYEARARAQARGKRP